MLIYNTPLKAKAREPSAMRYPTIHLNKNEERRIQGGHLWIYSNEIDHRKTQVNSLEPGSLVRIETYNGAPLGIGYINPKCLLCARLLSRKENEIIDTAFFISRIKTALLHRQSLFDKPYYRLIYSEGDQIPGLIVDRFGDTLVVQINTAGLQLLQTHIIEALTHCINPERIVLRNDSSFRELEGLPQTREVIMGNPEAPLSFEENHVAFQAPLLTGQKTGWFFDHRDSRTRLKHYVSGKRVLDIFSYMGGWSIQAACFGAKQVLAIDSSEHALSFLKHNAQLNHVADKITTMDDDAFSALEQLTREGKKFDVIILDPPALIKRKKDLQKGMQAYLRLNVLALTLLEDQGILISSSCSMHLGRNEFVDLLRAAALKNKRFLQIIEQGHQAVDHPIHPAIPETEYLKTFFCRVIGC